MDFEEFKRTFIASCENIAHSIGKNKPKYFEDLRGQLREHYKREVFPDNYETRYRISVEDFGDGPTLYVDFLHGDFNLGFGSQLLYPLELWVDDNIARFLKERLSKLGLCKPGPIPIDDLVGKLFPDVRRKRIIGELLRG